MNNTFRAVLLASVAAGGISIPHFAAAADAAAAATQVEEIVVTGSRIKRDTFNTPVPVSVVTGEQIRDSGRVSIAEVLMDTPVINANTNAQNSSGTLFLAGQARADIRGLGTSRTLVLMDGRRVVFSDASSPGVDLNMIPSMMVDRIDTVPGGGSAVYGSEAIAGVVNLIMKKSYDGFQFDAQGGLTGEGDGAQWRAAGMWGGKFANDRLNVLVGAEASRTEVILQKDRDYAYPGIRRNPGVFGALNAVQGIIPASKSNTAPTATFELISSTDPSKAVAYTLDYRNPTSVVKLSPQCSTPTVQPTCQDDALFYSASLNALQGRASRGIGRFYADYQLTDNVKAFADIMYSKVIGFGVFQPAFSSAPGGGTMPVALKGDNAYLNGTTATDLALKADWLAAGKALTSASTAQVGKFWGEFGGRNVRTERETTRVVVGMNGDLNAFSRKLSWDWYYQYGETSGSTASYGVPNVQKVQWATDAITVGGNIVCRATTVAATAAAAAGCVPWNLIDGGSAAAIAYANAQSTTTQDVKQSVLAGNVTADLLQLPAGPLAFALGAEYRQEQSEFVQDALGASGALFFNAIGTRAGKYNVGETYAELRIPILKDIPFAKELTVELAGRHSNYSTINRTNQWSARVEWTPVQDITFRANQGTAVRAPNIVELFSPQSVNFTTAATDPCDKDSFSGATAAQKALRSVTCAAAIPGYNSSTFVSNFGPGRSSLQLLQGGNPGLGPETAHTYQLGFVAQPRWIPHLQIALDYFKYNIDNQVGTIPINTLITNLCYESTTAYAANPFCSLIKRDPTGTNGGGVVGGVTTVVLTNQNVAKVKVEGYDASVQYGVNLEDWFKKDLGSLALRVDATWEYRFALQGLPGQAFTQLANNISNATPEWKGLITAQWTYHDLQLAWTTHYIGSMASTTAFAPTALSPYYTGDYYMHDVRASYKVSDKLSVRGGILNVTDEPPPALPETFAGTGTGSSTYDNRGRYFYVGANLKY